MIEKIFTPKEANQTLPLVKKIVGDILHLGKLMHDRSIQVASGAENDPQIIQYLDQLEELFEELEGLGCSYRDWNFTIGLVDFPALIEGELVSLCWKSDEESVLFYHGEEEGFAGRKRIPSELL